jgi:hypothetical protein
LITTGPWPFSVQKTPMKRKKKFSLLQIQEIRKVIKIIIKEESCAAMGKIIKYGTELAG